MALVSAPPDRTTERAGSKGPSQLLPGRVHALAGILFVAVFLATGFFLRTRFREGEHDMGERMM